MFFFSFEEIYRSGKIDFSAYISRRVIGVGAADNSYLPGARNAYVLLFFKFRRLKISGLFCGKL